MSYPPPIHSYQRGMVRNGGVDLNGFWPSPAVANVKAAAAASSFEPAASVTNEISSIDSPPSTTDVSPIAELHQALLSQKRAAQAAMVAEVTAAASGAASPAASAASATFVSTPNSFPALPTSPTGGRCAVHAIPSPTAHAHTHHAHSHHSHAHPAASSSSCVSRSPPCSSNSALKRASFWNTRCSCIFSALPDELLLFNVFSFLTAGELCAVAPVCSRWKFLSTDRLLWKKLDLAPHARSVNAEVFDNVMSRVGPDVSSLKLCNLKLLDGASLRRLGQEHFHGNHSLRELHFCSLKAVDFSVMESLLSGSGRGCGLRELSLFGCINVDDACVKLIRAACPRLEDLSLRGCLKITDAAFIEEIVEGEDQPEEEQDKDAAEDLLADFSLASRSSSLASSDSFSSTSSSFSSSSSSSPSSSSSASLVGSFANLTSLNVANCKLLTSVGLVAAFRSSPLLQKLNLHALNASDALLDVLTGCCPGLETLHLSSANPFGGNLLLTDRGVELLATRLPNLQCLNLQGSSKITDGCIPALVEGCPNMEKLNLGGCFKLTDGAVRALAQIDLPPVMVRPSRISHLSLFQCMHLTDNAMEIIANNLHALQHLDVHSCASITDRALQGLMHPLSAEQLQQQQQSSSPPSSASSSQDSLDDFAPSTPTASAAAAASPASSSAAPSFLLPLLSSLDVGSCRKISKEQVAQLKAVRTNLIVTHY